MPDPSGVVWRKSSRSSDGPTCVEVARLPGRRLVRDSKDPTGPVLSLTGAQWRRFLAAVAEGVHPGASTSEAAPLPRRS